YNLPGPGRRLAGSPDGRHWFAVGQNDNLPAMLAAQTLPDPEARALADAIVGGKVEVLFGPGSALSLRVDGGDDKFRKTAAERLTARLQGQGLKVQDGQMLTLAVQLTEGDTGKTMTYRVFGKGDIQIPIKQIDCQATLTGQGVTLWQLKQKQLTPNVGLFRA